MTTLELPYETVEEIREKILAVMALEYEASGQGTLDTSEGSYAWIEAHAQAIIQHDLQVEVSERITQALPHRATGDMLDAWAVVLLGAANARLPATAWYGTVTVTRTGSTSGTLASGTVFVHTDGNRYETTDAVTVAGGASGTVAARSTTTGASATKSAGATYAMTSPPAGWSATVEWASTTTTSIDRESDAALQLRVFQRLSELPGGANCAHFRFVARAASASVADAFIYPIWDGKCTVTVVPIGGPGERILPSGSGSVLEAVAAKIATELTPIGWTITTTAPNTLSYAVVANVTPDDDHQPDWVGTFTVGAAVPGDDVTRVRVTTDPTSTISADMWVQVAFGAAGIYDHRQVSAVGSDGGGFYIDVANPSGSTEVALAASTVYPGSSSLYDAIHAAVQAVFDALGPSRSGQPDIAERWPDPDLEWYPELPRAEIVAAIQHVAGVKNTQLSNPPADLPNAVSVGTTPVLFLLEQLLVVWA